MKLLRGLVIVLLVVVSTARADTTWVASGNVSGVWNSSGSPYMVHTGDITVATGQTLLINPGVKVYFAGQFKLIVNGLLQAIGSQSDSIWFTGSSENYPEITPLRWNGLRFNSAAPGCQLSYCNIMYGGAYGAGSAGYGGGVYCYDTDLQIAHSLIQHCHCGSAVGYGRGCGLYVEESSVVLEFSSFSSNHATMIEPGIFWLDGRGTGVYGKNAEMTIRSCAIERNFGAGVGGGLYLQAGTHAVIEDCVVDSNNHNESATAIYADTATQVTMTRTTISNNSHYAFGSAGGMRFDGAFLIMEACTLRGNIAGSFSSDSSMTGGLFVQNPESALIEGCVFEGNSGELGGALSCNNTTIVNTLFRNNSAGDGGALSSRGNNRIIGCRFEENSSGLNLECLSCDGDGYGGAIYFVEGTDSVMGCTFVNNFSVLMWQYFNGEEYVDELAGWRGGALGCKDLATPYIVNSVFVNNSLDYPDGNGTGSVLYNAGGNPTIEFCTMNDNDASGTDTLVPGYDQTTSPGGVIYSIGGTIAVRNCIISNSVASTAVRLDNNPISSIGYNDVFECGDSAFAGNTPAGLGTISTTNANGDPSDEYYNIYLDPEYVDVVNGDLHLSDASPCVGGADPFSTVAADFENNARPLPSGSVRDIGAFESVVGGALMAVEDLVIGSSDEDQNDVVLRWSVVSGAQSYQVYSSEAQEYIPGMFNLIGTTADTMFVDDGVLLLPATQRTYIVRASVLP